MTYRNKLLLKRILIILGVLLAVLLLFAILGFTYLGRYVVYTEDGAYFSFHAQTPAESATVNAVTVPNPIELVIGESISAGEAMADGEVSISDRDVRGMLVDYNTLSEGTTLFDLDLSAESCNTLALEMRAEGSDLLSTPAVLSLIQRAKAQDVRLIAMISCLDDSTYALEHQETALKISGGALWMNSDGNYWLDPAQDAVIAYLADIIHQLSEMGFDEVILNQFSFPYSDSIVYDTGDSTRDELLVRAYNDLVDATIQDCDLGLLVSEPSEGHQALDAADRLYVYFSEGSQVKEYAERHPDHYLVFVTDSHDTRFDSYGKLSTEHELDLAPIQAEDDGADNENTPESDETDNITVDE